MTTADFTDVTGKISVQVKTCDWSPASINPWSSCTVNPGWTLTGGGAEIEGEAASGSRLLMASYPWQNGQLDVWEAHSHGTEAHRVRAYAIGIKLFGLTESQVRALRDISNSTTVVAAGKQSIARSAPASNVVVGGGAEVLIPTTAAPGSVLGHLIASRPDYLNGNGWMGSMISTGTGAALRVYAISLRACPSGWNGWCLSNHLAEQKSSAQASAYATVAFGPVPSPWIQTGIGGMALNDKQPQVRAYLADLIPFNGSSLGVTARSLTINGQFGSIFGTSVNLRLLGNVP